jgi:hypothetical protein
VAIQTGYAAQTAAANMNAIFTGLLGISNGLGDTSAFLPQADEFDYLAAGARAGKDYRSGLAIEARQARIDQNLQFVRHDPELHRLWPRSAKRDGIRHGRGLWL